ncbi:MAG: TonB-dependent siderophore receptor [Nitrobacter sp.]|nr:TonB-dependent siderophore receptor [Nitrobacter sp.]
MAFRLEAVKSRQGTPFAAGRLRRMTSWLLASTILCCAGASLSSPSFAQQPVPASAQSRAVQFSIPAQPLPAALDAFIRATGWQVGYSTRLTDGHRSTAVNGMMPPAQALRTLLAGTGINLRLTGTNTATLVAPNSVAAGGAAPSGAISLDTIDVQGETAWGPANGFVASRSATATKTDTPIVEVPQSISVVTRDQIETRRNLTLNETLQYTPGVFAGTGGHQHSAPQFQIRGFQTTPLNGAFYLNGLRSIGSGDLEPYGLERVEVMRGPASVLYGQGQPSGVIALVTKRPTEQPFHEVRLQGGSFEQRGGAFDFGGPIREDRTLLYRFTGLLREGGNGIDFSNDKRAFLSGAVTWRPTTATEITAFGLYQKDQGKWNFGLPARGTALPNPNGRIPITRYIGEPAFDYDNTESTAVGYNLEHRATDGLTFRQNLQYGRQVWDYRYVSPRSVQADLRTLNRGGAQNYRTWDSFAVDNQAELKANTGPLRHTVLFGVDYRWGQITNVGTDSGVVGPIDVFAPIYNTGVFMPPADYGTQQTLNYTGIYLQDQIKLDRWIVTLGGRYDWSDLKTADIFNANGPSTNQIASAFTKRGGLGYEFDSGVVPYIGYSESFLPVSGTTFDQVPFNPETGKQYEAGIKYQPRDTNLRLTAAVYDLRRQNVTTADPAHPGFSIQTGEISSRGFEFEAVASLTSNLNLTAAYAYNDARVTQSNGADLGKRPFRSPPHLASLWADYTIRDGALSGLGFGGGIRYVSASAGDFLNTFEAPAYTVVDAMARYDIDNWRFSVNATNLFDAYYVAACFSTTQCNVGRTRTVLGTVTYRW